jgi:serine/threonine protein kinase
VQPGDKVDRYEVLKQIGTGGMAEVFLVRHQTLDTLHALKLLTRTTSDQKRRLILEGKVQAKLRHPNVVAVTDVFKVDGVPGLLMEYVEGPSMDSWLVGQWGGGVPLEEREAVRVFGAIVGAVQSAHELGIAHRDLKPQNILMASVGGRIQPKVADFGLAKALQKGEHHGVLATRSGVAMGTPAYMAPEQIRDAKSVDERGDIFALGAILYELLTGRRAFLGGDILDVFNAVAQGRFLHPLSLRPDLSMPLVTTVEGCLQVDRLLRLQSCRDILAALEGRALVGTRAQAVELSAGIRPTHSAGPQDLAMRLGDGFNRSSRAGPGAAQETISPFSFSEISSVLQDGGSEAVSPLDIPSVRQGDAWEALAERDSKMRENEGMRKPFEDEEHGGGVRAKASHVLSVPDREYGANEASLRTLAPMDSGSTLAQDWLPESPAQVASSDVPAPVSSVPGSSAPASSASATPALGSASPLARNEPVNWKSPGRLALLSLVGLAGLIAIINWGFRSPTEQVVPNEAARGTELEPGEPQASAPLSLTPLDEDLPALGLAPVAVSTAPEPASMANKVATSDPHPTRLTKPAPAEAPAVKHLDPGPPTDVDGPPLGKSADEAPPIAMVPASISEERYRLSFTGDVLFVQAQDSSGKWVELPAPLPPGRYPLRADFGRGFSGVGSVQLKGNKSLACDAVFETCGDK